MSKSRSKSADDGDKPSALDERVTKPTTSDTVDVWSELPHPLVWTSTQMVEVNGDRAPIQHKMVVLPGQNRVDRELWEQAKQAKPIQQRLDARTIGEGVIRRVKLEEIAAGEPAPKSFVRQTLSKQSKMRLPAGTREVDPEEVRR